MEGFSKKGAHLLDFIPKESDWNMKSSEETSHGLSEEKKLELRLGPPGGDWTISKERENQTFNHYPNSPSVQNPVLKSPWQQQNKAPFLHLQPTQPVMKESSQPCNSSKAQKRTAPAPVVGWPPIRSFRKNFSSGTSSKPTPESPNVDPGQNSGKKVIENVPKSSFVKINIDGFPIGRKVDLKSYDSYEKLSCDVDQLFRGLLSQRDSSAGGIKNQVEGGKMTGCLLDGSGDYTLVYEDNEGDRMLVGDVPWHMFVSTVKRLRVLKSSELPTLSRGSKQGTLSLDASSK